MRTLWRTVPGDAESSRSPVHSGGRKARVKGNYRAFSKGGVSEAFDFHRVN